MGSGRMRRGGGGIEEMGKARAAHARALARCVGNGVIRHDCPVHIAWLMLMANVHPQRLVNWKGIILGHLKSQGHGH